MSWDGPYISIELRLLSKSFPSQTSIAVIALMGTLGYTIKMRFPINLLVSRSVSQLSESKQILFFPGLTPSDGDPSITGVLLKNF